MVLALPATPGGCCCRRVLHRPGQGAALWKVGLPMTAQWHKPVGRVVLDHFCASMPSPDGVFVGGGAGHGVPQLTSRG